MKKKTAQVIFRNDWVLQNLDSWLWQSGPTPKWKVKRDRGRAIWLGWDLQGYFNAVNESITTAPSLGLLNLGKPFRLYVSERRGSALGMSGQMMGPVLQPMTFLSKQLYEVAREWPTCLQAVEATILMVKQTSKLTLGQPTIVYTPHQVQAVLETKRNR